MRDDEKDHVTAFRVCIPAEPCNNIMDPRIWSNGVVLRDWQFKKKVTAAPQHGTE